MFEALEKSESMRTDAEGGRGCRASDRGQSARDSHRTFHAANGDGRVAAALEHFSRRHELRWTASRYVRAKSSLRRRGRQDRIRFPATRRASPCDRG